jgi:hypothetical protein
MGQVHSGSLGVESLLLSVIRVHLTAGKALAHCALCAAYMPPRSRWVERRGKPAMGRVCGVGECGYVGAVGRLSWAPHR